MKNWLIKDGKLNHPIIFLVLLTVLYTGYSFYKSSLDVQADLPPFAFVEGTKTVSGSFTQGGAITYTIILTNNGDTTQSDNPGSEFTDTFSTDLTSVTWTCAGAGGGSCTAAGAGDISDNLTLPAGGSVTYTVNATVGLTFDGVISNQGTINYDFDVSGTNESTGFTDDTAVGGATDPTDFTVPPAVTDIDCGFRVHDGTTEVAIACESGAPTSLLQTRIDGTTYGLVLVDPSDIDASKMMIKTAGGVKALKAF